MLETLKLITNNNLDIQINNNYIQLYTQWYQKRPFRPDYEARPGVKAKYFCTGWKLWKVGYCKRNLPKSPRIHTFHMVWQKIIEEGNAGIETSS